jgi:hypothetical protein
MEKYDCTAETLEHIKKVRQYLYKFGFELSRRANVHDESKLSEAEKPYFDEATPKLKTLVFGTEEYKASLQSIKPALDHHYKVNDHHPEHYQNGINGMTLQALTEMVCDWCAASKRSKDGKVNLDMCIERFKIEPQLADLIRNTLVSWNELATDNTGNKG